MVGESCRGASLASPGHRRVLDVVLVGRDEFPSTTVSTHGLWPNGLARLEDLGILDTLQSAHQLNFYDSWFRCLGNEIVGGFTSIGGFEKACAPRRIVLDKAGV